MNHIIHIDGPDKTGKDYIKDMLVKRSKGEYLVIARSFMSQIAYSRIYDRKIYEDFFFSRMYYESVKMGTTFVLLTCNDIDVVAERFKRSDEKDIHINQFLDQQDVFIRLAEECREKGIAVLEHDTSHNDPEFTYKWFEYHIIRSQVYDCTECLLAQHSVNKACFEIGAGPLIPWVMNEQSDFKFNIKFLIVGMNPSKKRIPYSSSPFIVNEHNDKNEVFLNILNNLGISKHAYITNAVKCSTTTNKIDDIDFVYCNVHLRKEIEAFNPEIVVALGKDVYDLLVRHKNFKQQIVQIYHPSYQYAYNKITPTEYQEHIETKLKPWL